ncbi:MAG: hypothetical protein JXP34_06895 [Planctomycetes bacterium]|nr:hypothetical protein [Planctomycetota bacterium]
MADRDDRTVAAWDRVRWPRGDGLIAVEEPEGLAFAKGPDRRLERSHVRH